MHTQRTIYDVLRTYYLFTRLGRRGVCKVGYIVGDRFLSWQVYMAEVNSLVLSLAVVVPLAAAVEVNFLVWCPYCRHCLSHSSPVCVRLHASGYVQLCSVCTCMSMCGYVLVDVYVCVRVLLGPLCIWMWWCVRWCDGGSIGDVRPGLVGALPWDPDHHQGGQGERE